MRIPKWAIDLAEREGACEAALKWLRKRPRTFLQLAKTAPLWANWATDTLLPPHESGHIEREIERLDASFPSDVEGDLKFAAARAKLLAGELEKYFKGRKPRK